ncbi:MAG: hypothetical protein OEL88_13990 [Sterolibacteriaceae bacterium MAG5]|nr:hypothetical protein [Candidatus Nitricoxidireducens bremensis]
MSMFDAYTTTEAVEIKRQFLGAPKKDFLRNAGLVPNVAKRHVGRHRRYDESALKLLDDMINAKAVAAETARTIGERIQLAIDYQLGTDAHVGREMGVSRELVRQWRTGIAIPRDTAKLAATLKVPEAWLVHGGEENLPADSHIGVRVGNESMRYRTILREQTEALLDGAQKGGATADIQAFIEAKIRSDARLMQIARRAGGRWQLNPLARHDDVFVFAPWQPIHEHGLTKRYWSDDVEALIAAKMASGKTVYAIARELKHECEANGWKYPTRLALYKRISTMRERIVKFGVDLNDVVAMACATFCMKTSTENSL